MGTSRHTYTEVAIFRAVDGNFLGEYVAACANDRCGYLGEDNCCLWDGDLILSSLCRAYVHFGGLAYEKVSPTWYVVFSL
jgi:hypothetical protein